MDASIDSMQIKDDTGNLYPQIQVQSSCTALKAASAELCDATLNFTPLSLSKVSVNLVVSYSDGTGVSKEYSLSLSATATNFAYLKFTTASIDFGTDAIGYSATATLNVWYNGSHITGSSVAIQPATGVFYSNISDPQFSVVANGTTCGTTIVSDCTIKLAFAATSIGAQAANLLLSYFNGSQSPSLTATLQGIGSSAITLAALSASSGAFGSVVVNTQNPPKITVAITRSGSVPADAVVITSPTNPVFVLDPSPTSSTCLASTSISGPCQLAFNFTPTSATAFSDNVILNYTSHGQQMPPLTFALTGTGVLPALMVAQTSSTLNFGTIAAYQAAVQTITFKNTGGVAISNLSSSISLSDSVNYTASYVGCAGLGSTSTCTVSVTFNPKSASSSFPLTGSFSYIDGQHSSPQVVSFSASGVGTAPAFLTYQPGKSSTVNFGNVMIGSNVSTLVKDFYLQLFGTTAISNSAQLTSSVLSLNSPFVFIGGTFPGTGGCTPPLNPTPGTGRNTCIIPVGLTTSSIGLTAGVTQTQSLQLNYTDDSSNVGVPLHLTLQMTPQNPPAVIFQSTPSFSTLAVGDSQILTFVLKNQSAFYGTTFSSTTPIQLTGDVTNFTLMSTTCTAGLAAGASCNAVVKFQPTSVGTFTTSILYTYGNQLTTGIQLNSASISASGSALVKLVASPVTLNFPTSGKVFDGDTVPTQPINLVYFGQAPTAVSLASPLAAGSPFNLDFSSCGNPGPAITGPCTITVSFAPLSTSTGFTLAGNIKSWAVPVTLNYTNAVASGGGTGTLALTLNAVSQGPRGALISVSSSAFSKTLIGANSSSLFTLTNNGTASLTFASNAIAVSGNGFTNAVGDPSILSPCVSGGSLAIGASCQIKVSFNPAVVGVATGHLSFNYIDNGSGASIAGNTGLSAFGTTMVRAFAGGFNTCIMTELKGGICWGDNSFGQLGQGSTVAVGTAIQNMTPINFGTGSPSVQEFAVGAHHVCAIINNTSQNGLVSCWGDNSFGQLGLGTQSPALLSAPKLSGGIALGIDLGTDGTGQQLQALHIAAGFAHTCVILNNGSVKCWGANSNGQLGVGSTTNVGSGNAGVSDMGNSLGVVNLKNLSATAITAGAGHSCAVLSDGSAKCWGDNTFGQLGQGVSASTIGSSSSDLQNLAAISLGSGYSAVKITGSPSGFTCVTFSTGELKCFGHTANDPSSNPYYGVLGICWARAASNSAASLCSATPTLPLTNAIGYGPSDMGDALFPIAFGSLSVSKFAAGNYFGCSIFSDKSVRCWGVNDKGQLGIGNNSNVGVLPADMGANLTATIASVTANGFPVDLAVGNDHACAVMSNNAVICWGGGTANANGGSSISLSGNIITPPVTPVYKGY
jgi:alpha-tubulin suppressor-like RCC1 family protein